MDDDGTLPANPSTARRIAFARVVRALRAAGDENALAIACCVIDNEVLVCGEGGVAIEGAMMKTA